MMNFFLLNLGLLLYIYTGFFQIVKVLARLKSFIGKSRSWNAAVGGAVPPGVTVFTCAFNEGELIAGRLRNIWEQDYPHHCLEIIVVSDGSTDRTSQEVRDFAAQHPDMQVELIEFPENQGKPAAQNAALARARYDIIVGTDADNLFMPGCLKALVAPFTSPAVGVVGGVILYRDKSSQIAHSIKLYRSFEHRLRQYETSLGVMGKIDGPCVAFRRLIWEPIESYEDTDSIITLLARKKGYLSVQAEDAVCLDSPNVNWQQEFRQRSRMTRKNLHSIFNRWKWHEWLRFPGFTLTLFSHKILRYFSPFILLTTLVSGLWLVAQRGLWGPMLWLAAIGTVGLAIGWYRYQWDFIKVIASRLGSFLLANAGFAWGVIGWLRGQREGRFVPTRTL